MTIDRNLWLRIVDEIEQFRDGIREVAVTPRMSSREVRSDIEARYAFDRSLPLRDVADDVIRLLRASSVHVTHPRYFGLFNPQVREAALAADTLVALFNPQIAASSHAPAAYEIERLTTRFFASKIGFDPDTSFGGFTSGGAESNLSAAACAIALRFPESSTRGIAAIGARPTMYTSTEGHHSFLKVARMTGLGTDAIRMIESDDALRMRADLLEQQIERDVRDGFTPLMIIGTAGTTSAGAIDPLRELARIARAHGAWFHVDAAWGGSALLSPRLRPLLDGIALADSVTWDAHKWLSVPMSAGMFFCRHPDAVHRAFAVSASYMPPSAEPDPFCSSVQWSRRAIGMKVFLALAELGVDGYASLIEHQTELGNLLRAKLTANGWRIVNHSELPVVCFTRDGLATKELLDAMYERGRTWISAVTLRGEAALRACITSYETTEGDLDVLVSELSVSS